METLEPGVSSPKVKVVQDLLNRVVGCIGVAKLDENGDYDDATTRAVAVFQQKANIGYSSGKWDATTRS